MREVAAWTLPHEVEWGGQYMFSTHYFAVVSHTLFVSMYHGGIWAVDLSGVGKETFTLLPSVGVFLPTHVSPKPPPKPVRWAPTVEGVRPLPDGTLVTFDSNPDCTRSATMRTSRCQRPRRGRCSRSVDDARDHAR